MLFSSVQLCKSRIVFVTVIVSVSMYRAVECYGRASVRCWQLSSSGLTSQISHQLLASCSVLTVSNHSPVSPAFFNISVNSSIFWKMSWISCIFTGMFVFFLYALYALILVLVIFVLEQSSLPFLKKFWFSGFRILNSDSNVRDRTVTRVQTLSFSRSPLYLKVVRIAQNVFLAEVRTHPNNLQCMVMGFHLFPIFCRASLKVEKYVFLSESCTL